MPDHPSSSHSQRQGSGRLLVTGARGFIGRHLVRRLATIGYEVHVLHRHANSDPVSGAVAEHVLDDGPHSMDLMIEVFKEIKPDAAVHLASHFLATHRPDDIEALINSNVLFGTRVLEALVQADVHRFINTGSYWQNYENAAYNPVCLYAATKQAFEDIIAYYANVQGLRALTLRLFDTYGPDDQRPKLFALLEKTASSGIALDMSAGEQLLDLVHVDDVVGAYVKALEHLFGATAAGHEVFGVSSGRPQSLRSVVATYSSLLGREIPIRWGARPYREREVMVPWNQARPVPGWEPTIPLADGIRGLLARRP